ncbi:ASF1 anti-silencing function 1 [Chytriomyces hyalinus]|uniref:Anti-silencing function protein 1 n=1 Tax=Chytriomyces confervae TaxID=246404 RepID=A0A507E3N3_9FUNG|nr:ASF1 anti-silencing function 1 [Chytriomyces hyalinus]KAJ3400207.1 ASF1 anti-silencing function 1 [Chytriomyces hyalinus]TPX58412.1 hypothetical protein CcCBS67573_g09165 [Chytriomyces confervae]
MSIVNLTNISILNNPSTFDAPFSFEITFEVISELQEDLEFKLIYVGSAESEAYDQVLEEIMVGPVPVGVNKFVFQADPPKVHLLPQTDILGVTVVILQVSYREKEFIRVGYYVNTDYKDEALREQPPPNVDFSKVERSILEDKPRVTRFNIPWDTNENQQIAQDEGMSMDSLPFQPAFGQIDTSALMKQSMDSAGSGMPRFGSMGAESGQQQGMEM